MMPLARVRTSAAVIAPFPMDGGLLYLVAPGDPDDSSSRYEPSGRSTGPREDLPYKVEIWNEGGSAVEQVVAVTANASIGYAAYYAATREFPDRYVTLRHHDSIVSRWNGPERR